MTHSSDDEAYLRRHIIPYLLQFPLTRDQIHWVAVDRQYLLPNSIFNIIIQFHPGFIESEPHLYPPGAILARLNSHAPANTPVPLASSFNLYQRIFGSTKNHQFQHLCNWYFSILPTRGSIRGCQAQVRKGHTCVKSHSVELANQLIHSLLIEAGAPLQPLLPVTLEQPDIELETFVQSHGVLTVPTGCTSLDQTKYEPNYVIATNDSEAIIHRLVWIDTQDDASSLDRLTTADDHVHDLRTVLGRLIDDRKKHSNKKAIRWITRLIDQEGQPTNCILIQCRLDASVSPILATWNRDFRGHWNDRPLQPFFNWWLHQRLPHYPNLYQQICQSRWIFIRRADGRLVHGCSVSQSHGRGRSHEPELMKEFIQCERVSAAQALVTSTNQIPKLTPDPSVNDFPAAAFLSQLQPMDLVKPTESLSTTSYGSIPTGIDTSLVHVETCNYLFNSGLQQLPNAPLSNSSHSNFHSPTSASDISNSTTMNDSNSNSSSQAVTQTVSMIPIPAITDSISPRTSFLIAPRTPPTPIEARHPYYSSYPLGSILIDSNLNSTGIVITQPPTQPFTSAVNQDFNLYVPTGGLFEQRFRDEWSQTGQLSNDSRREDVLNCFDKFKDLRLLTSDMDLLMVQRVDPEQFLLHFRSHDSLTKLMGRFQAVSEGRPLSDP